MANTTWCPACGKMCSSSNTNSEDICKDCTDKHNEAELEAIIIERGNAGKKSSQSWLKSHGYKQE